MLIEKWIPAAFFQMDLLLQIISRLYKQNFLETGLDIDIDWGTGDLRGKDKVVR